jgi:hypothetical protein
MYVIRDRLASRAEEVFLPFVRAEEDDASLRNGLEIRIALEFDVADACGDVKNVKVDSTVLSETSARPIVDVIYSASV